MQKELLAFRFLITQSLLYTHELLLAFSTKSFLYNARILSKNCFIPFFRTLSLVKYQGEWLKVVKDHNYYIAYTHQKKMMTRPGMLSLLFPLFFFLLGQTHAIVNSNCSGRQAIITVLSANLSKSELSTKPDLNSFSSVSNLSNGCCLYDDSSYKIIGCDSLLSTLDAVANFNLTDLLQIALHIGNNAGETTVQIKEEYEIELFDQVYLFGYGAVEIIFYNNSGPFSFVSITDVIIQHITFSNGGVSLQNCINVMLNDVHIRNSPYTGCSVHYAMNYYTDYREGNISFTIMSSFFIQNGITGTTRFGGGLFISIEENFVPSTLKIHDSIFFKNSAYSGGAVSVLMKNLPLSSGCQNLVPVFSINNCQFYDNRAIRHGGALYFVAQSALYGLEMYNCCFINNSAARSGGAFFSTVEDYQVTCSTYTTLEFYECVWMNNSAELSAVIGLLSTRQFRSTVTLERNLFSKNYVSQSSFGGLTYCIVFCYGTNLTITDSNVTNNSGSGLCVRGSTMTVKGTVTLYRNTGYEGGGIFLDENGWLVLTNDSILNITENKAIYGGGLYQTSVGVGNGICFVEDTEYNRKTKSILFSYNEAYTSGNSIFFQTPSNFCQIELTNTVTVLGGYSTEEEITSSVYNIKLQNKNFSLILGQQIIFTANVSDFFGYPATTFVNIFLLPKDRDLFKHIPYNLAGFTSFSIRNGSNDPDVHIVGPSSQFVEDSYDLIMSVSQQFPQIELTVPLNIHGCVLGFTYNKTTSKCDCASSDLECDFSTGQACVRQGYWHGMLSNRTSVTAPCLAGHCQNIIHCSICPSIGLTTFCHLPVAESDECIGNWGGVLCTECISGYSYTFQAQQCVDSSTCRGAAALIPAVLVIVYLLIVIGLIVFILKLGYQIRLGYMYSVVYYFSVVKLLLPANLVNTPLQIIVSLFQSLLQLNPFFLSYIPICISTKMTILEQKMLLYLIPFIVSVVILSIVGLSRYCSRYMKFRDNSIVKAISLLALLSFTALTETSFSLIIPIKFEETDSTHVDIQPSTRYLDPSEHLPWFLIAILVMVVLVLPFTLLLIFAPLLVCCVNLNKIKPFLDEFQSCYKDHFRWMAGYYFLCRIVVFLSLIGESVRFQYTALILSIFILLFHMILQPYQDSWLNVLDSVLLVDLVFTALLYTTSSEIVYAETVGGEPLRQFLTSLLVVIPMFYIVAITTIAIAKKLPYRFKEKLKTHASKFRKSGMLATISRTLVQQPLTASTTTALVFHDSGGYREPLLEFEDSHDSVRMTPTQMANSVVESRDSH